MTRLSGEGKAERKEEAEEQERKAEGKEEAEKEVTEGWNTAARGETSGDNKRLPMQLTI